MFICFTKKSNFKFFLNAIKIIFFDKIFFVVNIRLT